MPDDVVIPGALASELASERTRGAAKLRLYLALLEAPSRAHYLGPIEAQRRLGLGRAAFWEALAGLKDLGLVNDHDVEAVYLAQKREESGSPEGAS